MKKLFAWLITPIYIFIFCIILLAFHPIVMIAHLFGYRVLKFWAERFSWTVKSSLLIIGSRFSVSLEGKIPEGVPIIFVANHQSMFDIPFFQYYLRHYHPKFISKKELGKWLPSISFILRNGKHLLINRSDKRRSLAAISKFAKQCNETKHSIVLFPEGTRARDGVMKKFKPGGLVTLVKKMPDAVVVPIVIDGTWKILKNNFMPVEPFPKLSFKVFDAIDPKEHSIEQLTEEVETFIRKQRELL